MEHLCVLPLCLRLRKTSKPRENGSSEQPWRQPWKGKKGWKNSLGYQVPGHLSFDRDTTSFTQDHSGSGNLQTLVGFIIQWIVTILITMTIVIIVSSWWASLPGPALSAYTDYLVLSSQQPSEVETITIPILQVRKLRFREAKESSPGQATEPTFEPRSLWH